MLGSEYLDRVQPKHLNVSASSRQSIIFIEGTWWLGEVDRVLRNGKATLLNVSLVVEANTINEWCLC